MAMDDLRAKELASIEPPASIAKIVQFTDQLSFGQEGLFSGTELAKPKIGQAALASKAIAGRIAERPYSFFPGANGEGIDMLMSRYTLRTRDIQDFSRWLMHWNDIRSQLAIPEAPELVFLRQATPESIERFEEAAEVRHIVVEGRRRTQTVTRDVHEVQIEERVVKTNQVRNATEMDEAAPARRPWRGHPQPEPEEPSYRDYWKEEPARPRPMPRRGPSVAAAEAESPIDLGQLIGRSGRNLAVANLALGGLSFGVIRGRADAAEAFRAQLAAQDAMRSSPVAPYMPEPSYEISPNRGAVAGAQGYPQPDVSVTGVFPARTGPVIIERGPNGQPIEVTTDWPGAPVSAAGVARPEPRTVVSKDYVLVPKEGAEVESSSASGTASSARALRPAALVAATVLAPAAFAATPALPGFTGAGALAFASVVASRPAMAPGAAMGEGMLAVGAGGGLGSTVMPAGSLPRRDVLSMAASGGAEQGQWMVAEGRGVEAPVRTPIPANPLMGQITLVAPPVQVASRESERAGSAVSFNVRDLAKGGTAVDGPGLAMLKSALPPGAQAIYPALPAGQLGPNSTNLRLAPSLLTQILSEGYGPAAATQASAIGSMAGISAAASQHNAPTPAKIVPTPNRPTDASANILGNQAEGAGALSEAGAASGRGGALGFLGMPVRLAPSLAGDAQVKHAAEARQLLPPGAAAIIRPQEFSALKSKVFPGIGTVNVEPDKAAWQKAAPSFGLRDAEPQTILSPDARIKRPEPGSPLPQMEDGAASPAARALRGAAEIGPAMANAGTAHDKMPGGSAVERAVRGLGPGESPAHQGFAAQRPAGLSNLGARRQRTHPLISLPAHRTPMLRPAAIPVAGAGMMIPAVRSGRSLSVSGRAPLTPTSIPHMGPKTGFAHTHPAGAGWTPTFDKVGHPVMPNLDSPPSRGAPGLSTGSSRPSRRLSGLDHAPMPSVSTDGATSAPVAPEYARPALARPAIPTTAGAAALRSGHTASAPSTSSLELAEKPSSPMGQSFSSSLFRQAPDMPVATSVAGGTAKQSMSRIQKAQPGGAVRAHHEDPAEDTEESTNSNALDPGAAAQQVNVLANEVWSLLKRKLRFEAERLGRRF